MNIEMMTTIPNEPIPISAHWCMNSFQYILPFSGLENMPLSMRIYRPKLFKNLIKDRVCAVLALSYCLFGPVVSFVFLNRFHQRERLISVCVSDLHLI